MLSIFPNTMFLSLPYDALLHHKFCQIAFFLASKAEGVQAFYDVLFNHWEKPLKELHASRVKKAEDRVPVIEIPDDDQRPGLSLEELEAKSLEHAEKGIIIDGGITDDVYCVVDLEAGDATGVNPGAPGDGDTGSCAPEPLPSPTDVPSQPDEKTPGVPSQPDEKTLRRQELIQHIAIELYSFFFNHSKVWKHGFKKFLDVLNSTPGSIAQEGLGEKKGSRSYESNCSSCKEGGGGLLRLCADSCL